MSVAVTLKSYPRVILFQRLHRIRNDIMSNTQHFNLHLLHPLHFSSLAGMRFGTGGWGKLIYTRGLETGPVILSARVRASAGGEDGILASG